MSTPCAPIEQLIKEVLAGMGEAGVRELSEAQVRSMVEALAAARSVEPDFVIEPGLARRLADGSWKSSRGDLLAAPRRVLAALVSGLGSSQQFAVGYRGAASLRLLSFESEFGVLTVEISEKRRAVEGMTTEVHSVAGQWKGGTKARLVTAIDDGKTLCKAEVDEEGFFMLEVRAAAALLEIDTESGIVELPRFSLRDEPRQ